MTWTYKKTELPGVEDGDFVVYRDGVDVGRIVEEKHGQNAGTWTWYGYWVAEDNSGRVDTKDAALNTLRDACPEGNGPFEYRQR